jgi:hypothetical protein
VRKVKPRNLFVCTRHARQKYDVPHFSKTHAPPPRLRRQENVAMSKSAEMMRYNESMNDTPTTCIEPINSRKRFARLNLTLPAEQKLKLAALAEYHGVPVSELLRAELRVLFRRESRRMRQEAAAIEAELQTNEQERANQWHS